MKHSLWPTRDPVKDYFPLPKEIFSLGLSAAEIAIYAYLLFCEDRQTFQCWPSYRKISEAVGLSPNTIRKHIRSLEERDLLVTEPTQVTTKDGRKRNGNPATSRQIDSKTSISDIDQIGRVSVLDDHTLHPIK